MDVLLTYFPKNHANSDLGAVIFWGQNQTLGKFVLRVFNTYHWILKEKINLLLLDKYKHFMYLSMDILESGGFVHIVNCSSAKLYLKKTHLRDF